MLQSPIQDLKDTDVLCTIKDHEPFPNHYQDLNPKLETSSILQSANQELIDLDVLCTIKIIVKVKVHI